MSANTTVYVKVAKLVEEIIEVSAVTLEEAREKASEMQGVGFVLGSAYNLEEFEES